MPYEYDQEPGDGGTATDDEQNYGASASGETQTEEVDREKLEQETKQRLADAFADTEDDDDEDEEDQDDASGKTAEDEDESDETDEDESDDTEEEDDSSESDEEDEDDEEAAAEDEQPSDAPTLPDAYRRSLYAYGWKDEEINANLRNLGDSFIKTAERIHENRNTELQQWAQAGRQAREQQDTDEGQQGAGGSEQQPAAQSAQAGQLPQKLNPVDADKLKEQYGEDELIDAIVNPVNATIQSLNSILPQIQQGQQAVQQAEVERVSQQVDQFFGRDEMQTYNELYGDNQKGLSDEQLQKRNQVLDTAYDLMLGASNLRGQQLPLPEALEHAHEIVAKDYKDTATRKGLKKQAKKRNRGLSQKPSRKKGSSGKSQSGRPQSRDDLENRTKSRLKDVFGD